MKLRFATAIIAGALMLPVAGYAADTPKQIVKDSVITTKIKAEMAKDKEVSALRIEVETDHSGQVQLTGTAKSQAEADKAVAIAKSVKGVTSVENKIKVAGGASAGAPKSGTKY